MIASYYTRSKAPRPSECSDVEPSDVAPVAATSSPTSETVRPNVAAVGEPESMSTDSRHSSAAAAGIQCLVVAKLTSPAQYSG